DMTHLYAVFTMILMYATPIFYPADIIPAGWEFIQTWNPLYSVIYCLRCCFLYGTMYDLGPLVFAIISGIALCIIGIILLYKYQDKFILYV
ncbi:MAG: ABC transporter permease, partial [Methanobacteriaceae archaeon]|nr:ABC transporter permease [Methanobacteriaceae archaeon]